MRAQKVTHWEVTLALRPNDKKEPVWPQSINSRE